MTILKGLIETKPSDPRVELRQLTTTILHREAMGWPLSWTTPRLRAKLPPAISEVTRWYPELGHLASEDQITLQQARAMANGM